MKKLMVAPFIILTLICVVLGAYPNDAVTYYQDQLLRNLGIFLIQHNDIDNAKLILLHWLLMLFAGLFIAKSRWLKVYFVWAFICLITRNNVPAINRFIFILGFLIFYQISADNLTRNQIRWIYNAIAVIVLAHIGWMVLQSHGINFFYHPIASYATSRTPLGVYGNTNYTGALIALCMVVFLPVRGFRSNWWALGLIPIFYGLFLSRAFIAIAGAGAGLIAYVYLTYPARTFVLTGILSIAIVSGYFYKYEPHSNLLTGSSRFGMFKKVYEQTLLSPIKGYGLGSFRTIFPNMDKYLYGNTSPRTWLKPHNDGLGIAFNQGYTGLLLFLGFVFSVILKYMKRRDPLRDLALVGFFVAVVLSQGYSLTDTTMVVIPAIYLSIITVKELKYEEINSDCNNCPSIYPNIYTG